MEIYKATASLFLDKRKAKNDGTYPIKLTVYRNPDKKRYSGENAHIDHPVALQTDHPKLLFFQRV